MIAMKIYLKQENNYIFLTTSKVKFLYIKGFMGPFMCFIHTHLWTFFKKCSKKGWTAVDDWLQLYKAAEVVPSIEVLRKTTLWYHTDKIDVCKDAVSIPGISMKYILNNSLAKEMKPELYASRGIYHTNWDKRKELENWSCNGTLKCGDYCEESQLDLQAF